MRIRLIALSTSLAAATLLGQGQSPDRAPQPTSTFRGGVNYVRVDMNASRDGMPVTDLRVEEIDLLEDGVSQKIDAFEHVVVPSGGPEATRVQPDSVRASQQMAADARARVFVIFIDTYHIDAQQAEQMRVPIRRFLEEGLGPDDLVAVMTPEMSFSSLTFTRKTTILSGLFDNTMEFLIRDRGSLSDPRDATEQTYERCFPPVSSEPPTAAKMIVRRREKLSLDALNDLAVYLGSLRDERKTVLVVTLGWPLYAPDPQMTNRSPSDGPPPIAPIDRLRGGRGRDGTDLLPPDSTKVACEADRMALANLDHRERMREITGDANRANVSFFPITPLRIDNSLTQLSTLRQMAEETEGEAIVNTNNIAEPMRRVIVDMSSYYLLGYQSTNAKTDGRFRTIKVTVKRPGVQVRARKGYRAVAATDVSKASGARPDAPRPDDAIARAFKGVLGVATPVPLRIRASSWTRAAATGSEGMLWVVGELDASTRKEPGWAAGSRAEVAVLGADSQVSVRGVDLGAGAGAFAVRVPDVGHVMPGQYDVRITLRPAGAGGSTLRETTKAGVSAAASPLGEAVLLRRGPASGVSYVETADPRFRRNERLRLELPAASSAGAEARVVDRNGAPIQMPIQVSTRPDPSGGFQWIVVDATMAPFAAGDYAITVTQEGAVQVTAFRVMP